MADWKHRSPDQAREALKDILYAVFNKTAKGSKGQTLFSIPRDLERDADCVLADVIDERDALLLKVQELRKTIIEAVGLIKEHDNEYQFVTPQAFFDRVDATLSGITQNPKDETGNYRCLYCDWVSSLESRPLSRGTKVGCAKCGKRAQYCG